MGAVFLIIAALTVCGGRGAKLFGYDLNSCNDMVPTGISEAAQTTVPPYEVMISITEYEDHVPITVTLTAKDASVTFSDFLIQAQCVTCANTSVPVGNFSGLPTSATILECFSTKAAVTASTLDNKRSITLTWLPPDKFNDIVIMRASVVHSSTVWWSNIASPSLARKPGTLAVETPQADQSDPFAIATSTPSATSVLGTDSHCLQSVFLAYVAAYFF